MQGLTDDDRKHALGEVLFDELRAIREMLEDVPKRTEFNALVEKVDSIDERTKVIELVVKDHSKQLNGHERRISALEAA